MKGLNVMEMNELVKNAEFVEAAKKVETLDAAIELCKTYGVEITGEELVDAIKKSHDEELTDKDLDAVSGGGFTAAVYALGFVFGMSPLGALVLCGAVVVGGVLIAKYTK